MLEIRILFALFFHILVIIGFYQILRHYFDSTVSIIVFSYISAFIWMLVGMLALSVIDLLNRNGLTIFYVVTFVALAGIYFVKYKHVNPAISKKKWLNKRYSIYTILAFVIVIILFVMLCTWGLNYYDTTDDALTQGYPKLYFIMQHKSLFVNYVTHTPNIFCNEWLSELNCLYYMLMTGTDQSAVFGNIEVLFLTFLVFLWAPECMGEKKSYPVLAISLLTMPVVIGLSMTLKTDLFSMSMLLLAVSCLYKYYNLETGKWLFLSIVSIALSMASKISLLPGAGLLLVMLIIFYFIFDKNKIEKIKYIIWGGGVSLVVCNRYILNFIYYGTFFKRAENEKILFSFDNIVNSLKGIFQGFNEISEMIPLGSIGNWCLTKKIGCAGWIWLIILFVALMILFKRQLLKKKKKIIYFINLPLLCGLIFFCSSTVWYDWSFRYIAPYVVVFLVQAYLLIYEKLLNGEQKIALYLKNGINAFLLLAACFNIYTCFLPGQAVPYSIQDASEFNWLQKKLAYSSFLKSDFFMENEILMNLLEHGGKGLVYLGFSSASSPLFGQDGCVTLDLVENSNELKKYGGYDFYAVVDCYNYNNNYEELIHHFKERGCETIIGEHIYIFISKEYLGNLTKYNY